MFLFDNCFSLFLFSLTFLVLGYLILFGGVSLCILKKIASFSGRRQEGGAHACR